MSSVSPQLLQDFDDLAQSLGVTPVFDDRGEIVPIGEREGGKKVVYVVWVGRGIGLFHNWGLTSAMTVGFAGSSYKGYATLQQARTAWYQGPTVSKGPWIPPAPRPAVTVVHRQLRVPRDGQPQDLPPVVAVDTSPHHIPRIPVALRPSDSDEEYWSDDDASISPPHPPYLDSVEALSTTISSISSLSLSGASPSRPPSDVSPLSPDGTSTSSISLPAPVLSFARRARPASPAAARTGRPLKLKPPINLRRAGPSPPHHAVTAAAARVESETRPEALPHERRRRETHPASSSTRSPSSAGRHSGASISSSAQGSVSVSKPKDMFVVVRGDKPGIYLDRETAIFMAGPKLGTKVVVFKSMSKATKYFTEESMAGNVGVPVMVSSKNTVT